MMPQVVLGRVARMLLVWAGAIALLGGASVRAEEFQTRIQLIWGTDGDLPDGKEFKRLDPEVEKKFLRHLRWKRYFVVRSEKAGVPESGTKTIKMSGRCTVELERIDADQVRVRILGVDGEGKPRLVDTKMQSLEKLRQGHVFAYGGDSRDNWDDAWLVVITAEP